MNRSESRAGTFPPVGGASLQPQSCANNSYVYMQKAETGCYTFCDEPVGCRIYNANWQQQKSIMLQEGSEKTKCPLCIGIHHENIYSQQI